MPKLNTSNKLSTKLDLRTIAMNEVAKLEEIFKDKMVVNTQLSRSVVSFQANKSESVYRWFKYREGFSRQLIEYCLREIGAKKGETILDPFAGTGATIFTAGNFGLNGIGIELLPVGCYFMSARQFVHSASPKKLISIAEKVLSNKGWEKIDAVWEFPHIRITNNAFPAETASAINKYKTWLNTLEDDEAKLLDFVLFSVLEEISYTRKDGQYLRWDKRSPRTKNKSEFNKGKIFEFDEAIELKLKQIIADLHQPYELDLLTEMAEARKVGKTSILQGSVFEKVEEIKNKSINYVITSPPYCNRYDYTRTYALELAYLGVDELKIRKLRQTLLTCTVENKTKDFGFVPFEVLLLAEAAFKNNLCINAVLDFLSSEKDADELNNNGILTMVSGYFYETAVHLAQVSRKIKKGGYYIMVNDNVQYNGVPIPVDCILSSFAENLGFECEKIWVLPVGKGNSSQQMKIHGRNELRKCVYVWKKVT